MRLLPCTSFSLWIFKLSHYQIPKHFEETHKVKQRIYFVKRGDFFEGCAFCDVSLTGTALMLHRG
jgi:hypothetical protein